MNNDQVRRRILEVLYKRFMEDPHRPVSRDEMLAELSDLEPKFVDSNTVYLEKSGYLESEHAIGSAWYSAKILPRGVDLVEDKTRFNVTFNPTSNVQVIHGPVGTVMQIGGDFEVVLTDIKDLHPVIDREVRDPALAKDLRTKLEELEAILREDKLDKSRLSEVLRFFKTHAGWLVPILSDLITKTLHG